MTFNRLQPRAPDKEPIEPLVRAEGDSLYADRDRLCLAHHHSSSSDSSRAQAFKSRRTAATSGPGARSAESNRPRLSGRAAAERYRARPDPLAQVAPLDASFGDDPMARRPSDRRRAARSLSRRSSAQRLLVGSGATPWPRIRSRQRRLPPHGADHRAQQTTPSPLKRPRRICPELADPPHAS